MACGIELDSLRPLLEDTPSRKKRFVSVLHVSHQINPFDDRLRFVDAGPVDKGSKMTYPSFQPAALRLSYMTNQTVQLGPDSGGVITIGTSPDNVQTNALIPTTTLLAGQVAARRLTKACLGHDFAWREIHLH